jgi:fructose-bisphosphate aldolase class II
MTGAIRKSFNDDKAEFDPRKYLKPAKDAAKSICKARFEAFGTAGNASKIKPIPLDDIAAIYGKN